MSTLARVLEEDLGRLAGLLLRDAPRAVDARRLVGAMRRALRARRATPDPGPMECLVHLRPDAVVADCPLGCPVEAIVCVARQLQSQREADGTGTRFARDPKRRRDRADRSVDLARHDKKRGLGLTRPTCVTGRCSVGSQVRLLLGDRPEAQAMAARAPGASDAVEG